MNGRGKKGREGREQAKGVMKEGGREGKVKPAMRRKRKQGGGGKRGKKRGNMDGEV